ncbi:MAG TPA: hypothetical protein VKI61_11720 [Chitinophagaceae bacterium]|nr:hypothetical protein [Chitinophagaceae bacterium]
MLLLKIRAWPDYNIVIIGKLLHNSSDYYKRSIDVQCLYPATLFRI